MKYLGLLSSLFFQVFLFGQQNIQVTKTSKRNIFIIEGRADKLHNFSAEFLDKNSTRRDFIKFNRNRERQIGANYSGLAVCGFLNVIGVVTLSSSDDNDGFIERLEGFAYILGGVVIGGVTAGLGNAIFGSLKAKFKKRLLYTSGLSQEYQSVPRQSYVSLEATSNGIGLVYYF